VVDTVGQRVPPSLVNLLGLGCSVASWTIVQFPLRLSISVASPFMGSFMSFVTKDSKCPFANESDFVNFLESGFQKAHQKAVTIPLNDSDPIDEADQLSGPVSSNSGNNDSSSESVGVEIKIQEKSSGPVSNPKTQPVKQEQQRIQSKVQEEFKFQNQKIQKSDTPTTTVDQSPSNNPTPVNPSPSNPTPTPPPSVSAKQLETTRIWYVGMGSTLIGSIVLVMGVVAAIYYSGSRWRAEVGSEIKPSTYLVV
jgi:hypothetical protein